MVVSLAVSSKKACKEWAYAKAEMSALRATADWGSGECDFGLVKVFEER